MPNEDKLVLRYKLLAKGYVATNQPNECINLVKDMVQNDLPRLNSTQQAWCLLKFTKTTLLIDADYAKALLT